VNQIFKNINAETGRLSTMGPVQLKRQQVANNSSCPMFGDDANPSMQYKDGFNRFWQLFGCPEIPE
jgi:hypothetical protein